MNERINELAEQAEMAANMGDHVDVKIMMAKFAELIVRECARVYWRIDDGEIHGEYVNALKKHFGVE
jgi:hypothetical protein